MPLHSRWIASLPALLGIANAFLPTHVGEVTAPEMSEGRVVTVVVAEGMPSPQVAEIVERAQSHVSTSSIQPPPDEGGSSLAVAHSWRDYRGQEVLARGDVMAKLYSKHRITNPGPVRVSTQWPDGLRSTAEGTARVYWATLLNQRCTSPTSCTEVDKTRMKTVVDFRYYSFDGRTKGLVTSYCPDELSDRCPSWVNGVK